eukprot:scaffold89070_cov66-Phaeocystis_antarctica.AAC.1
MDLSPVWVWRGAAERGGPRLQPRVPQRGKHPCADLARWASGVQHVARQGKLKCRGVVVVVGCVRQDSCQRVGPKSGENNCFVVTNHVVQTAQAMRGSFAAGVYS